MKGVGLAWSQVREVAEWLAQRWASSALRLEYEIGTVTRVQPVGMGDRCSA
jgi:hypothetical protein